MSSTTRRGSGRVLMAYFSRAGENYYYYGGRRDLEVGNTAVVAETIARFADVDLHEMRAAEPYPHDYDATVQRNTREQDTDARPRISGALPDLSGYDIVLLGSGIWSVHVPMIMRTFVEAVDLSGRTVHPVVTHAVSGIGQAEGDYRELLPGADLGESLVVQGEEVGTAEPQIRAWLRRTGLADG